MDLSRSQFFRIRTDLSFSQSFIIQLIYKRVAGVPEDLDEFCRKCDEYIPKRRVMSIMKIRRNI